MGMTIGGAAGAVEAEETRSITTKTSIAIAATAIREADDRTLDRDDVRGGIALLRIPVAVEALWGPRHALTILQARSLFVLAVPVRPSLNFQKRARCRRTRAWEAQDGQVERKAASRVDNRTSLKIDGVMALTLQIETRAEAVPELSADTEAEDQRRRRATAEDPVLARAEVSVADAAVAVVEEVAEVEEGAAVAAVVEAGVR